MKKTKPIMILAFLILFSLNPLFCQNTEQFVKTIQARIDEVIELINRNDIQNVQFLLTNARQELVKFEAYKDAALNEKTKEYEEQILQLKSQIDFLNQRIADLSKQVEALKNGNTESMIKMVESTIKERNNQYAQLENLRNEKHEIEKKYNDLISKQSEYITNAANSLNEKNKYLELYENSKALVSKYKSAVKIGLSIGFNSYWNNQRDYIVQKDSTIKEVGKGSGASGIISGVVSIRLSDPQKTIQHSIVANLPLGDFTSNSDKAIGLFNNRIAVGLGYSVAPFKDVPYLSFTGIFNMSPYEKLDYETLSQDKVLLPRYAKLKPQDFGATTDISYSFTIGIVYSFINIGNKSE